MKEWETVIRDVPHTKNYHGILMHKNSFHTKMLGSAAVMLKGACFETLLHILVCATIKKNKL